MKIFGVKPREITNIQSHVHRGGTFEFNQISLGMPELSENFCAKVYVTRMKWVRRAEGTVKEQETGQKIHMHRFYR